MTMPSMEGLTSQFSQLKAAHYYGSVSSVSGGLIGIENLTDAAQLGDQLTIFKASGPQQRAEVLHLGRGEIVALGDGPLTGVSLGDAVRLDGPIEVVPGLNWIGRVIDPYGSPLDGRALTQGPKMPRNIGAPDAAKRRALGARLETGLRVFNTMLPIVKGQRIGLFAGSGVGKSRLLGALAKVMQADLVVIGLVGERGRELRDFIENVLGPEGMKRAVIVAATSDRSALVRRRCAETAMQIAEYFRDTGKHVLLLTDSITRLAEAHREVAVATGEASTLRGFPASTSHVLMELAERAGPGIDPGGDITAIFTVLVAGSDMEEPIADIMRGVLDGHVVLDRGIAERGRYPAIDVLRSVSRSLPDAASERENALIAQTRRLLGTYDTSELMVKSGLYTAGSDPELDLAVKAWPFLDGFMAEEEPLDSERSFARLELLLRKLGATTGEAGAT